MKSYNTGEEELYKKMAQKQLEDILQAYVEQGTVPDDILTVPEAASLINRFNCEREERPRILEEFTVFRDYSLLADFLRIPVVEMEQFAEWEKEHPRYLKGKGNDEQSLSSRFSNQHTRNTLNNIRWANQLTEYYQFWEKSHKPQGIQFNGIYLTKNGELNTHYQRRPKKLYTNSRRSLKDKDGINHIAVLSAQQQPELAEAWTGPWNEHIATLKLRTYYEFWKKHHNPKGIQFNTYYLQTNEELNTHYERRPRKFYDINNYNLKDKQGINHIIGLASQQDNNIAEAWTGSWNEHIATLKLQTYYQHWKTHHKQKGIEFNTTYLIKNQELNKHYQGRPGRLYNKSRINLNDKGGIKHLVLLAAEQQPEILQHWKKGALLKE